MRNLLAALAVAGLWLAAGPSAAQPAPNDYGKDETWLCRPGRSDACAIDMSATVVSAKGGYAKELWATDPKAPVDCFYVYPTVSNDPPPNSDMIPNDEERRVASRQLARFGAACRIYAPLYRQLTLSAIRDPAAMSPAARELAYGDVLAAWKHYLAHDNQGRGVILYGHSQGAGVLKRLIAEEIDGKPIEKQMIAAYLIGTNVLVPTGKDVGGDFKATPICRNRTQTGCVVSYVSFRESAPPPEASRFGRTTREGMSVACANPAALGGGSVTMSPVFGSVRVHSSAAPSPPWSQPEQPITTPYVRVPGLVSAKCVSDTHGTYLAWRVNADPKDPRTDTLAGDHVNAAGQIQADWGTHSLDVPVAMGDLIALAGVQGRAWLKAH